jgi:ABC-2 type transport system ATP-binding protein
MEERARGTTILFCTHIISDVEALCDRLAIVAGGRVMRQGQLSELVAAGGTEIELVAHGVPAGFDWGDAQVEPEGQPSSGRVRVRCSEPQHPNVLRRVIEAGAVVERFAPRAGSLEEVFLTAVRESGHTVGGEIS